MKYHDDMVLEIISFAFNLIDIINYCYVIISHLNQSIKVANKSVCSLLYIIISSHYFIVIIIIYIIIFNKLSIKIL